MADGSTRFPEVVAASIPTPPSGKVFLFVDSADKHIKIKDDTGTVTDLIEGGAPVSSVFGRTGAVIAVAGDYDADQITYTPIDVSDWDSSTDPGDVNDALDQLADRLTAEEAHTHDASAITYTPSVLTDWDGDADPGNVDDALDQLAERVDDVENTSNVFGQNYQYAASEGESTTTSESFQDKVSLTTPVLTGTYRVGFCCRFWLTGSWSDECEVRFTGDVLGTLAGVFERQENEPLSATAFRQISFSSQSRTFRIQFRTDDNDSTAHIDQARIEFWRVA